MSFTRAWQVWSFLFPKHLSTMFLNLFLTLLPVLLVLNFQVSNEFIYFCFNKSPRFKPFLVSKVEIWNKSRLQLTHGQIISSHQVLYIISFGGNTEFLSGLICLICQYFSFRCTELTWIEESIIFRPIGFDISS